MRLFCLAVIVTSAINLLYKKVSKANKIRTLLR